MKPWRYPRAAALASLALTLPLLLAPLRAADRRIVAVADVHGGAAGFISILQRAAIIDADRRWSGGTAVLVQTGDTTDRGADVRTVLDFLMDLERQARAAGGRVEMLLGNHEVMNFVGNTRYVTPEILAAWADARSESRRERAFTDVRRMSSTPVDRAAWMAAHPPGYIEYREAFAPDGKYGRWLRTKPAIVEIDGTVFMHAGIDPAAMLPIDKINERVRTDVRDWDKAVEWLESHNYARRYSTMAEVIAAAEVVIAHVEKKRQESRSDLEDEMTRRVLAPVVAIRQSSLLASNGPLWFRGFANWTAEEGAAFAATLLKTYGVRRFVTGHTPQDKGEILSRFDGALYLIDTGMLGGTLFPGGRPSALEVVGDRVTPLYVATIPSIPIPRFTNVSATSH